MNRFAATVLSTALLVLAASSSLYAPATLAQSGPTTFVNWGNARCLDVDSAGYVTVVGCVAGRPQQLWVRTTTIYGYQIKNYYSNRCLTVNSSGRAITATCNGSQGQGWRASSYNVNAVFYTNRNYPGRCLDGTVYNAAIVTCNNSALQAWG